MTLSRRAASLLTGLLLLATGIRAQTPLGQPTLDEQKVQVWCATVRYVYDDNGRSNLKSQLQCGSSLKAFENSIRADSQRVYSALYQPLEGKGSMYKGLGSNPARLQKLTTEIVNRLKSSPARRKDPARMQRLATLEVALANYVQNGTPIGDLSTAQEVVETVDTTANLESETTAATPGDDGLAEAGVASAAAPQRGAGESLMNKFFGPLALIMSLLSLVLYVLLRRNIGAFQKELSARIDRRREEIMALQNAPASTAGATAGGAARLTAAQQQEVERIVSQRVEEALRKLQRQPAATPPVGTTPAPVVATAPVAPAPATAPEPAKTAAPVNYTAPTEAPAAPSKAVEHHAPESMVEQNVQPAAIPAGSPAATLRDEFDSLVPPVHLPAPEPHPAPASPTRYVKVPVNSAFNEYDLSEEPQHDSIYEIRLSPEHPELATFRVTSNPAVHAYAIQSAQYSLREACIYQQPTGPVTRIVNEKEGQLRKIGGAWQIEQKAAIRFE